MYVGGKTTSNVKMGKVSMVSIIFLVATFPNHICSQNKTSDYYDLCKPFPCGNINFSFPFSPTSEFGLGPLDCGLPRYQIACDSGPSIELSGRLYSVKQLSLSADFNSITVVDHQLITDLSSRSCESLRNLSISTFDVAPLTLPSWGVNLTLYRCPSGLSLSQQQQFLSTLLNNFSYTCQDGDKLHLAREVRWNDTQFDPPRLSPVLPPPPTGCQFFSLPVSRTFLNSSGGENGILLNPSFEASELIPVLREGFPLEWPTVGVCESCKSKGGRCGYDISSREVVCFCRTGSCQQVL